MQYKNKQPVNEKGQAHGKWEHYFYSGKLMATYYFVNDVQVGYSVFVWRNNGGIDKEYYAR